MVKNKKKLNNVIFDDEEDFNNNCEKDLYIEAENLEEDTEFLEFLRKIEYPKAPAFLKEKAMAGYRKHYRYQILWRTIKLKAIEYKEALFGSKNGIKKN